MVYQINSSKQFRITLNGSPIDDVVSADDEAGVATICCHDLEGKRIPDGDSPSGYQTMEVKGKIVVEEVGPKTTPPDYGDMPQSWWDAQNQMGVCLKEKYWDALMGVKKVYIHMREAVPERVADDGALLCKTRHGTEFWVRSCG